MEHFTAKGGELQYNRRLKQILIGEDGGVSGFEMSDGSVEEGDLYVSAMSGAVSALCLLFWPPFLFSSDGSVEEGDLYVSAMSGALSAD